MEQGKGRRDEVTTRNEEAAQTDTRKVDKLARISTEDFPSKQHNVAFVPVTRR
jgi:hypothetical protein